MSGEVLEVDDNSCCASCGITANDDIKLKICTACRLVRYCSIKCQKEHRPKHKRACKKRVAELRDELLFKQPESNHLGDCPICCLPHPVDRTKAVVMGCCGKKICEGCDYANKKREVVESLQQICPFCRHPAPKTVEEADKNSLRRVESNDPLSLNEVGVDRYAEGDYAGAFKYWTKAAESGDAEAHFHLSVLYQLGKGVEKDRKKEVYHLEKAAIAGHPIGRYNLGCAEFDDGSIERAVKHFIIAANLGHNGAMKALQELHADGYVSKEDFAAALRAHQAAVDATKSPQREFASVALQQLEHDKLLFKRPECSHLEDCPICLLPMDLDNEKNGMLACCSKLLCDGCMMAKKISEEERSDTDGKCPFCRQPCPKNEVEMKKNIKKRVDANDPFAIREKGLRCYEKGDHVTALELWTKAANLGDIDAHFRLGKAYSLGEGVEKDVNKQTYYYEIAAIGGHPSARFNLGAHDFNSGNIDRGVKHIMISASHGHDLSIQTIKQIYPLGYVTKEEFAAALRAHKAAVDATKSIQREASAEAQRNKTWPYVFHPDKGSHISHPRIF